MITPQEIQEKVFDKAVRGYNAEQVDQFLDDLTASVDELIAERDQFKADLEAANAKLDEYKAQESAVIRTLESAKSLMNDISASAEKRAEIIMKNAQLDADQLVRAAQDSVSRLKDEEHELSQRVSSIRSRLKTILQTELDRFDNMDQDILGDSSADKDATQFVKKF